MVRNNVSSEYIYDLSRPDKTRETTGLSKCQNALPALRIAHPMDTDCLADVDVAHILGRDQDILFLVRSIGGVDHHLHTDAAIDSIHENVELI